jgi:hypothetical protein
LDVKTIKEKKWHAGIQTYDLLIKMSRLNPLGHHGWDRKQSQEHVYIAIFITNFIKRTSGCCSICRHNKHSHFYRTLNIRRLRFGKFSYFKTLQLDGKSPDHVESEGYITLRTLALVINSLDKTSEASGAGFADQTATADHQNVIII